MQAKTDFGTSIGTIAFASAIGTTIEWYDFFLFGVVTPRVFNKLFFPNFDPLRRHIARLHDLLRRFISRPVGGIIFGHDGDRIGRKTVLVLTILIMGIATFLIGLLPTYASVGIWAPIMLLFLRVFQGIGIGGEWGGAVFMAVEHSPTGRRGFYGSWPQIGVPAGLLLSSGMVYLLSYLPEAASSPGAGSIAFLISAAPGCGRPLYPVEDHGDPGLYAYPGIQQAGARAVLRVVANPRQEHPAWPRRSLYRRRDLQYFRRVHRRLYRRDLGLPRQTALAGVMIASAIMIIMLPIYGNLSDRIGRRRMFGVAGLLIGILSFPAFWLMQSKDPLLIWIAIAVPFAIVYPAVYGPQAALFSELFDTRVRYTGDIIRLPILRHLRERANTYHRYRAAAHGEQPALVDLCLCAGRQRYQCALGFAMTEAHKRDMAVDSK